VHLTSNDLSIFKNSLYLEVMQEADDEDHRDGQENEAHRLEGDKLLQLHVILIDCPAV
jgi:hypothetical protein